MCGVFSITSTAATRLLLRPRTRRCETIARRYCDRSRKICACWSRGNRLMMRSSVSALLFACSVAMHEVPGAGQRDRRLHRLAVADFADQDHVRRGAHGGAKRPAERARVEADLALVDDRLAVLVQELDRVLDRQDMVRAVLVAVVDHRRERRGLAGAGRADHQHEAALQHRELAAACPAARAGRVSACPTLM